MRNHYSTRLGLRMFGRRLQSEVDVCVPACIWLSYQSSGRRVLTFGFKSSLSGNPCSTLTIVTIVGARDGALIDDSCHCLKLEITHGSRGFLNYKGYSLLSGDS